MTGASSFLGGGRTLTKKKSFDRRHHPRIRTAPDPYAAVEIRKSQIVELLREKGPMRSLHIRQYFGWPEWIFKGGSDNPLTLLREEGRIGRKGKGNGAIWFADPDITELIIKKGEADDRSGTQDR